MVRISYAPCRTGPSLIERFCGADSLHPLGVFLFQRASLRKRTMTRFRVANSQAPGPTRSVRRVFGWSLRFHLLACWVIVGWLAAVQRTSAQSAAPAVIFISGMDG